MTIEPLRQGGYRISDIVGYEYIIRVYYYYTKKEAIRLFRNEVKGA